MDTALRTLSPAEQGSPLIRIELLNTRAVVWSREKRWNDAESDLAKAVALARQQRKMDSAEILQLLTNYAHVLRKPHRGEAGSVERWAAAIRSANTASGQVIDVTELAALVVGHR